SDYGVEYGLAGHSLGRAGDVLVGIGVADALQPAHAADHLVAVDVALRQPGVGRHVRLGHHVARVDQVDPVPVVRVAAAHARQVRTGALGPPLERAVVDRFAGQRVVAVALGLEAQGAHHLRVAVVAALAHVHVAPGQLQRRVGFDPGPRRGTPGLVHQRDDLRQAAERDHHRDEHRQQADVLLDLLVGIGVLWILAHACASARAAAGAVAWPGSGGSTGWSAATAWPLR